MYQPPFEALFDPLRSSVYVLVGPGMCSAISFAIMFLLSCVTDGRPIIRKRSSVTGRQEHPLILSHPSLLSFSWLRVQERQFEGASRALLTGNLLLQHRRSV